MEYTNETQRREGGFLLFDPIVVVRDVLKHWAVILLITLALGVGAYIMTDASYSPQYQSKVTFVVTTRGTTATVYNNLSSVNGLASVFSELINSSVMRKYILQAMGAESFGGSISASVVSETNLLNMTVTASDPRTAFLVAQAIVDHHEKLTYQVLEGVSLEVLKGAQVATAPINRLDAVGNMEKALVLAFLAACTLFACLSVFRDTIRSGQEARNKLDCDYLGDIPHERKCKTLRSWLHRRKTGVLVTNPVTGMHYVENLRKLTHRVEQHMGGGKVLLITSVLENEGKSTAAVNMALTMARRKKKVLLIDCDLRKPALYKLAETKAFAAGTRDVLTNPERLPDAVVRYKNTGLYLILEKRSCTNSGDLLGSAQMQGLLNWARREFDFVILDMPPMSMVSDTEIVADLADASLLLIRQNSAMASAVNRAIAALDQCKATLLGCVLNDVRTTFLSSGQGYRYGSYGGYNQYGKYGHYGRYGAYGKKSRQE
jgi:capsular exopolysaccharide synthesis family protein